jgi:hypothetical protein
MNVRLVIPETYRKGNVSYYVDLCRYLHRVASIAGGYTCYRGHGGWIDSKGVLVEESVTIVDCSHGEDNLTDSTLFRDLANAFRALAKTIAVDLSQECVFLSIDGKAEFIRP